MLRGMDTIQARWRFWSLAAKLGPGTFVVRRMLQRLESGELSLEEALQQLERGGAIVRRTS